MKEKVLILCGSASDLPVLEEASKVLDELKVSHKLTVASAHRTPARVAKLVKEAEEGSTDVIIAAAGMAAHLAGAVAAQTTLPVIGVPLNASPLGGLDALLSTVQMPGGMPVATVSIGKAGAKNAAILAAQIVALRDKKLAGRLRKQREKMTADVEEKARELENQ